MCKSSSKVVKFNRISRVIFYLSLALTFVGGGKAAPARDCRSTRENMSGLPSEDDGDTACMNTSMWIKSSRALAYADRQNVDNSAVGSSEKHSNSGC